MIEICSSVTDGRLHRNRRFYGRRLEFGSVIGAGLFVGSGAVIAEVGPAAFITYVLTGVLIIGNDFRDLDGEFRQR
jgi:GABA permease